MPESQNDCSIQVQQSLIEAFDPLKTERRRNIVEFMDDEYTLPPHKGGQKWITQPDQIAVMLMWAHPDVLEMIASKATQRGFTEIALAIHMWLLGAGETSAYFLPTDGMAKRLDRSVKHWQKSVDFVGDKLLADKNSARDSRNTISEKEYTTANQYYYGGSSAVNTSQFTASFITIDEAERTPGSVEGQGSLWAAADGRGSGLLIPSRKRIFSSPLTPDGIITMLLGECDHIFNCEIPCPLCGEFSVLRFGDKSDGWGIRFAEHGTSVERSETVEHVCRYCKNGWTQDRYEDVIDDCRWVSESGYWFDHSGDGDFNLKIDGQYEPVKAPYKVGIQHTDDGAGLYGTSSWKGAVRRIIDYTAQYQKTQSTDDVKRFVNEFRAKPFEDQAKREIPTHELLARREQYSHSIPAEVQMLVVGIDFGLKYSNYELMGFGADGVCWAIKRERFDGDALDEDSRMFTMIEPVLKAEYQTEDERMLPVALTIMDGRYAQKNVQKLAALDPHRRIVVHGDGKHPRKPMFDYDPKKDWNEEAKCFEVTINPHKASARLYHKLAVPRGEAGYYHVPDTEDYSRLWADEITSDKKKKRKVNNQWIDVYEKDHSGIAGEAHDTAKYCLMAVDIALDYGLADIDEDFEPYRGKKMIIPQQVTPQPTTPTFDISDAY